VSYAEDERPEEPERCPACGGNGYRDGKVPEGPAEPLPGVDALHPNGKCQCCGEMRPECPWCSAICPECMGDGAAPRGRS
jgi:hypothetical protein